jgi:DNA repair exonuclease SbcCD ATPase subunit
MVRFVMLKVRDLFSYGQADVQFKTGLVLLEGRNWDRDGSSNMVGKSALWDALATVLWEENSRGQVKDDVVNKLRKRGSGVVVFEREGIGRVEVEYVRGLERKWVARVNGKVEAYNWDVMRRRVAELVGMSYEEFVLSSWFQQGMMDSFLVKSDTEKKELFMRWLGLDVFQRLRDKVKERRKEVEVELRLRKEMHGLLDKIKDMEVKEEELRWALGVLERWGNSLPVSFEEYRKRRRYVLEQVQRWRDALRVEGLIKELRSVRDELSGRVANIKEKMRYLRDGRCWVCGSEVDTERFVREAKEEVERLSQLLKEVEGQLRELEAVYVRGRGVDRERLLKEVWDMRRRVGDVGEYRRAVEVKAKAEEYRRQLERIGGVDLSVVEELEWELETARKWEKGLSDDGVVAYVLGRVLGVFNELMRRYGEVIGVDVRFRIGGRGQLEVEVSDGYKSMSKLNWWSGSERYLIMLVVMLGLSDFLMYQGKGTNLLVLDEVFAPLDRVNRERVVELLEWLKGEDRTVVVVTHHDDVKRMVDWDEVWVVEKKDGISCLRIER